jgi:hypothetical protein
MMFFLFSTVANAESYDIYINDDGSNCMILIDVASLKLSPDDIKQDAKQQKLREYLVNALKTVDQEKCTASSTWEAIAINVGNRDSYGQPDWSEVVTLQNYTVNLKQLKAIKNNNIAQFNTNQVIKAKNKS